MVVVRMCRNIQLNIGIQGQALKAPGRPCPATGETVPMATRLTFAGHSTVLIEKEGTRLLTDPVLRGWVGPLRRQVRVPPGSLYEDLDAVLLSHLHRDHLDLPSLRKLDPSTSVIAPVGTRPL